MLNEKLFTLIKAPIITEKSARLNEKFKQVIFKVEVIAVTTSVVKGKTKRNRTGTYKRSNYKKAFVTLSQDSDIQFEGMN